MDVKANCGQHRRQRTAAVTAAPAIHQRLPGTGYVRQVGVNMGGNVTCDQRSTLFFRFKRIDLFVKGTDQYPLVVIQRGPVLGIGNVVEREFGGTARVNDGVEASIFC